MSFLTAVLCATALFVQSISGQCLSVVPLSGCGGSGSGVVSGSSSNSGGAFLVQSAGPVAPRGLSASTDALQLGGNLRVDGSLPFLSAVAFDGQFPNSGVASVAYGCGDGSVGITQEIGASNAAGGARGATFANLNNCGRI